MSGFHVMMMYLSTPYFYFYFAEMDIKQEFEMFLEGMEWDEVVSTLIDVINDLSTPPQPPLPLLDPNQHLQLVNPVGGIGFSEEVRKCSLNRSFIVNIRCKVPSDPSQLPHGILRSLLEMCVSSSSQAICLN